MSSTSNTNEWRSLRELLEKHSPAVLATAIERHGVFVSDRYNRIVKASPESNDEYSQAKALDLIADWQAELNDPDPTYSWDHPRFEFEDHPTQYFGWPERQLPNFSAQASTLNTQNLNTPKTIWTKDEWIKVAQQEALVILKNERMKGVEPKQDALAKDVAKTLSSMGVRTSRGDITWENVKREALAGDWWRKTRQRPTV
jgi:hypothetical protein